MAIVTLIRHTTPAIAKGVCYGRLDVDVAMNFADEAAAVASTLNLLPAVTQLFSSPAKRTLTLAQYIARTANAKIGVDARLQELDFGQWEGVAWNDIARANIDEWARDIVGYQMPQGESGLQLADRVGNFYQDHLCNVVPHEHIVIVAHAGSIKALLARAARLDLLATVSWQLAFAAVVSWRID